MKNMGGILIIAAVAMLGPTVISLFKSNWIMSIMTLGIVGAGFGVSMYLMLNTTGNAYSVPMWLCIAAAWFMALSEKANVLWLCAECNTQNDAKREVCKKCGTPNPAAEWVCGACITKNVGTDRVCKKCGKQR